MTSSRSLAIPEGTDAVRHRQLIVVSFQLPGYAGHYYNELLGYRSAASILQLDCRIITASDSPPDVAWSLRAAPILDPQIPTRRLDSVELSESMIRHTAMSLEPLWSAIDALEPGDGDILLFVLSRPILIASVGYWLSRRSQTRRPFVFFRHIGDDIFYPETGEIGLHAEIFRIACASLRAREGQERVFLLASSPEAVIAGQRAGGRRIFLTSVPKHWTAETHGTPEILRCPTVHMHLNYRSGCLIGKLSEILQRVCAAEPTTKFIVKTSGLPEKLRMEIESDLKSKAELLPAEQNFSDYQANFSRCTVVLLPYDRRPYVTLASGVFLEAAGRGIPVVVPADTWMAQEISAGRGVGTTYEGSRPDAIASSVLLAIRDADELTRAARHVATKVRLEHSCKTYLERLIELSEAKPKMELPPQ